MFLFLITLVLDNLLFYLFGVRKGLSARHEQHSVTPKMQIMNKFILRFACLFVPLGP